jgi:integration host factor subunit alpha
MPLKKLDMVELLNSETGLSKAESKSIVDDFFETLITTLESGEALRLQQFGVFKLRDKRERMGRNPKNGKAYIISSRRVVSFKASSTLTYKIKNEQEKP